MTSGHKHRIVVLPSGSRRVRFLRKRRWHTDSPEHAAESRFAWGDCDEHSRSCYTLSWLGVLHGLFGLTLEVRG